MKPHIVKLHYNEWGCAAFKTGKGSNATGLIPPIGFGSTATQAYENWKAKNNK